jgi:segregation and condensation protein B
MEGNRIRQIIEAALMAADEPLSVERLVRLFKRGEIPIDDLRLAVKESLETLEAQCEGRGFELKKVASGYRFQVRQELSEWVSRLWEEKPGKYSRAFLETLALIAYKQPLTRADIEVVRGVAVSPNIIRTLMERGWIRIVGTRDTPGKPSLYGTTREFLDYFNVASLSDLPPLAEIRSLLEHDATEVEEAVFEAGVSVELIVGEEAAGEIVAANDSGNDGTIIDLNGANPPPTDDGLYSDEPRESAMVASNVVRLPTGHG